MMMTNGVQALREVKPGDVVLCHWGDAHHGNDTWYTWAEVAEYTAMGTSLVEQVGFFVALTDQVLTLVSSHGTGGTNSPWNIPRAWIHGAVLLASKTPEGGLEWP
jgi:hypothetical protein